LAARALLAAKAEGRFLVGPDNGLLSLTLQQAKSRQLVRLTSRRYWLPELSGTFHGRDILAPVAAHLAAGVPLGRLGTTTRRFQALSLLAPRRSGRGISGRVVHVDRFGNLITNLSSSLLTRRGGLRLRFGRRLARVVSSYAEGRPGELIALAGSSGYLELAVRDGSAARRLGGRRGDEVTAAISPTRPA
jgi:S-adenosylmethionine hydrolase